MNSPASMRSSKRACSAASSAERTGRGASSRSLPIVSIACVYMARSFQLLAALVDHPARLADERALEAVGQADGDRGRDADQGLDALAKRRADGFAIGPDVRRQE